MMNKYWLLFGFLALACICYAGTYHKWPFAAHQRVILEDGEPVFVLGSTDNKYEIDRSLKALVEWSDSDFTKIDASIKAQNLEVKYKHAKADIYFYTVYKQRYLPFPHVDQYGATLKVISGTVVGYGTSISTH